MMIYTGIGPRNAPPKVLEVCQGIGAYMAQRGWILRTGAGSDGISSGCDLAFRKGCESELEASPKVHGHLAEIYCPSETYSTDCVRFYENCPATHKFYKGSDMIAKALVRTLHPQKKKLAPGHLELHARNVHQQVGAPYVCYTRSNLIILWSPKGEPTGGGTGMAQKIYDMLPGRGSQFNIGIFDLDNPVDVEAMWSSLEIMVRSLEFEHDAS